MKKMQTYLLSILLIFLLCACGAEPLPEQNTSTPTAESKNPVQGSSSGTTTHPSGFPMTDSPLMVENFLPLHLTDEPEDYMRRVLYTDAYDNTLYLLAHYLFESGEESYMLYQFNADSKEVTGTPFSFGLSQYEYIQILSMDVVEDNLLSFRISAAAEGEEDTHTILYKSTDTGQAVTSPDSFPEEETYPWNPRYGTHLTFDSSRAGTLISQYNSETASSDLYRYDTSATQRLLIANLPQTCFTLCIESEDIIYYSSGAYIIRYNMAEQTGTCVASMYDCGLSSSHDCHMLLTEKDQLVLVILNGDTPGIYYLAKESDIQIDETTQVTLSMADLRPFSPTQDFGTQMAARLSTQSNTLDIQIKKTDNPSDAEGFRDRMINEMIAGKGPDLLLTYASDLQLLAEKGMLMDLAPMISSETRDVLFPHVVQLGTVDNTLYALPLELMYDSMLVSKNVWSEDSWTRQDLLSLIEDGQDRAYPIIYFGRQISANELLFLLLGNYESSPFLDFQKGICYFDSKEFIRLLELCKKYGTQTIVSQSPLSSSDILTAMKQGEVITKQVSFYDGFAEFSRFMNSYSTNYHLIGYPEVGTRANSSSYLIVNANSPHYQAIKQYVDFLLSYENQYSLTHPLRSDVYENRLPAKANGGMFQMPITLDQSQTASIEAKPNGESYLEEYLDFLNNVAAYRNSHSAITAILSDELADYMNNNKSARDIAAIIQSRVQLYLDENN